ncbi:FAD-dependent monooxygenase [Chondrinema litorale]|uniref:FAD-dependent monooxygenase n=1 Tax=Chondrinema litorale TaxID=2994555 RepID=UPI002542CE28|nr:FAD-dependent monooxygenase [Chondrinema litorale]UZR98117.1 FAD-dependent monooxygenase [Chondrinema litorale]
MNTDIKETFVILGGGIAGLSTAIALKRIGIVAKVYEAAPQFKPVGAGIILAINAMKAYKHIGLYNEIAQAGNPLSTISILSQNGKVITQTNVDNQAFPNVAIHRAKLHEILFSQLDENQIINNKKSKDVEILPDAYKISFEDGSTIVAENVIVAEGIHSTIRQKLIPKAEKRYAGYTCWRGIAENSTLKLTETTETWGKNGRFGITPINDNQVYWFAVMDAVENSDWAKNFSLSDIKKNFKDYHEEITQVLEQGQIGEIIQNDLHDLKPIKTYAFDELVLIGDAAHATTPNMGQGACQAIEDAVVLAECLKVNSSVKEAFKRFEAKRVKRTHFIVNQSWTMGKVAHWQNPIATSLRDTLLRIIPEKIAQQQIQKIYDFKLS